ncbi:MAG: hypothetical protein B6D65_00975 [candidate division Zixibacteria bacterium 4484_93]|nr:MAG: hypothetical protein B6D65_00975 [candidate division Zixibacteria bacterium 4484_93]
MLTSFEQVLNKAREVKVPGKVAVADAASAETLKALAKAEDIVFPILIGDKEKILPLIEKAELSRYEMIDEKEPSKIAALSVSLVRDKEAELLMKGKLSTGSLMKAVLDKENGIRTGKLLSHIAVVESPAYHKLMLFTDGGLNIRPTLDEKISILKNAVSYARCLGIETPKVCGLAVVETVNPKMEETMDAALISRMAERGQLGNVIFDGPLAMDIALSKRAAEIKGVKSPVAGDVDIFLAHDIVVINACVKALIYLSNVKTGGVILGAKSPIVLLSRSDSADTKLNSIALAAIMKTDKRR